MSLLPYVVLAAELGTLATFVLYSSVLTSMHIEARTMPLPRLDPVSLSLQAAAKYGFRFGLVAVVVGSLLLGGLT